MTTTAPLRKVLIHDYPEAGRLYGEEYLECGHTIMLARDWSYAARRRCRKCARELPREFDPATDSETWGAEVAK